jgi:hypothetical protein
VLRNELPGTGKPRACLAPVTKGKLAAPLDTLFVGLARPWSSFLGPATGLTESLTCASCTIKEVRNTSFQVKNKSLAGARRHFDVLKKALSGEPYFTCYAKLLDPVHRDREILVGKLPSDSPALPVIEIHRRYWIGERGAEVVLRDWRALITSWPRWPLPFNPSAKLEYRFCLLNLDAM